MSALAGLRSHCQGSGAAADRPVPLVKEQELPLHTLQSQMTRRHMMQHTSCVRNSAQRCSILCITKWGWALRRLRQLLGRRLLCRPCVAGVSPGSVSFGRLPVQMIG